MQFVLPLPEDGVSQRYATTLHIMLAFLLFGIGVAAIMLFWFTYTSPNFDKLGGGYMPFILFGIASILGAIVIVILSVFQKSWLRQERNNLLFRVVELVLLVAGSILFFLNHWVMPAGLFGLMALVVVFAIVREKSKPKAGKILIDDAGIQINAAARSKSINWKDIENVLLRFGTLTIECRGNKMIQQTIASSMPDAKELEQYCQQKIEANKVAAIAGDW